VPDLGHFDRVLTPNVQPKCMSAIALHVSRQPQIAFAIRGFLTGQYQRRQSTVCKLERTVTNCAAFIASTGHFAASLLISAP